MSRAPSTPAKRVAIAIELHWNLPWHLDTFQGIVDFGNDQGWTCVADPYLDGALGDGDLRHYDGVVGRLERDVSRSVRELGLPAVNLFRMRPDDEHPPSVSVDPFAEARVAAEHLLCSGYSRFGYVGNSLNLTAHNDRLLQTFTQTLADRGGQEPACIYINDDDLINPKTSKTCRQIITEWVRAQDKPIGLYIEMSIVARYLAQICAQLGTRIPKDLGIVVCNADSQTATRMQPTLTAIDIDYWEQGHQAARMLHRLMAGEPVHPRITTISPARVVARESTDVFLYEDELVSEAMRYIADNTARTLRVEELAERLHISRRTLIRRFKDATGQTASHAITRLRLQHIEQMITETDLPMGRIADLCGFGSPSHLSEYVTKHAGASPSALRKAGRRPEA